MFKSIQLCPQLTRFQPLCTSRACIERRGRIQYISALSTIHFFPEFPFCPPLIHPFLLMLLLLIFQWLPPSEINQFALVFVANEKWKRLPHFRHNISADQDTGHMIQDRHRIQNTKYRIRDTGQRQDTEYMIHDTGQRSYKIQNSGYKKCTGQWVQVYDKCPQYTGHSLKHVQDIIPGH